MSWTYEIALRGDPQRRADLQAWFDSSAGQSIASLPGLAGLDVYTPAEGHSRDPYNHDGAGPLMMLMLDFVDRDALAAAIEGRDIATPPPDIAATGAAFERRFYPVGDGTVPAPLKAPFSYVVRYHRPADDEAAFIDNYLATHPVTQAKLPAIRSIMCYVPVDEVRGRLRSADYIIGNEVVFDDIDAFNVAMASPVRQELRAHYHEFPRFTGANTHYPMVRTRLIG
jgi:hypothetical protein